MSAVIDQVLAEVKKEVRAINGTYEGKQYTIRTLPDEPGEAATTFPYGIVYPGPGSSGIKTSMGTNGFGNRWTAQTIIIDVFTTRQNIANDMADMRPFAWLVPNALFAAFARDRFNGTVLMLGDITTSGGGRGSVSTPVCRWQLIYPPPGAGGLPAVGWRFELDVTIEEDIVP
jgi:hypothetical protein